jgi:hypothetical protein
VRVVVEWGEIKVSNRCQFLCMCSCEDSDYNRMSEGLFSRR